MANLFTRSSRITHHLGPKLRALQSPSVYSFSSFPSSPSLNALLSPATVAHRNGQFPSGLPARSQSNNLSIKRFVSIKTDAERASSAVADCNTNQVSYFPGGKVKFIAEMRFLSESPEERISCYRVLDDSGQTVFCSNFQEYREPGILLWRGFTLQEFANQLFSNKSDHGKGRQMPIHYGSNRLNYFTISSTIATQIPQAVGAAYSLKMDGKNACAVTYFGDGGTSEGDFHAALNFASVMDVPIIFFCRNNGWAISTPTTEQFRSDGVVIRGQGYGIRSIRVDGNDALAVYNAVHAAREMAINESRPILVEALTYRVGHHSTSDDSTKYRPVDEIEHWRIARDPVSRYRKWLEGNGWWSDAAELELRSNMRKEILHAIQVAEREEKPPLSDLFTDVYDRVPTNLCEQEISLRETIKKHHRDYPPEVPI